MNYAMKFALQPIAALRKKFCGASLALTTILVSACGGGSDTPPVPPPPVATFWQAPQIAPLSGSVLLVQSDGADGVFVVGATNNDGLVIQRFSASAGWFGQTVELRGLKNLQAVALDDGVALFGRDATAWYRRDYTATGLQTLQTMFVLDFRDAARTDVVNEVFSRTHDGAILATAFAQSTDALPRARIQTREYRAGAWSALRLSPVLLPDGSELLAAFSSVDVVRSKSGDVARVRYQFLYDYTYVGYRAATEATFVAVTPALCVNARCSNNFGSHGAPTLELDGSATVVAARSLTDPDQWLAIRGSVPTALWPAGVDNKLATASPMARLLRADGVPIWLTDSTGTLALWEALRRLDWTAEAAALRPCVAAVNCVAISSPDTDHVAIVQPQTSVIARLYVTDRSTGRWVQTATVDASALQSGMLAGAKLHVTRFYAKGDTTMVVGYAHVEASATSPSLTQPFAFVKR